MIAAWGGDNDLPAENSLHIAIRSRVASLASPAATGLWDPSRRPRSGNRSLPVPKQLPPLKQATRIMGEMRRRRIK
jgi:hypothetical protein